MDIVSKAKILFFKGIEKFGSDPYHLKDHVPLVELQIKKCLIKEPTTNELVCLLGGRLHDIGHYPIPTEIDHAVRGADIARNFLQENGIDENIIEQVVHCVRSHRCRDIQPETLEARIVAFSDSASHLLDIHYLDMAKHGKTKEALEKLERDYRDLGLIPELKGDLEGLYNSWKSLLKEYAKITNSDKK